MIERKFRPTTQKGLVRTVIYLPKVVRADLDALAERERRSTSSQGRIFIERGLAEEKAGR